MGEIKGIEISIRPEYVSATRDMPVIMKCQIRVKLFGKDELVYNKLIPDNDFQSRFDWFIEDAVKIIKKQLI
jgi:hypothetical protein